MDAYTPRQKEQIQRDLARSVIKEPLYSKLFPPAPPKEKGRKAAPPEPLLVLIEANDEYFAGKEKCFDEVRTFVNSLLVEGAHPKVRRAISIGSTLNPYFKACLLPDTIKELVEADNRSAKEQQQRAVESGGAEPNPEDAAASRAPSQLARYLRIRRIWEDHKVKALIDRSLCTVKADAAQRAFLAEGRGIVWAVIDSGIDKRHRHFANCKNLEIELPIVHCDFTVENGVGSDSATTDPLGHGTHVAGILAGNFKADRKKALARRMRLTGDHNIEEMEEELGEVCGMAPWCKIVSMRVLDGEGSGEVSNIIAALDKIQEINNHGRDIKIHGVNLSVGYEFDPSWFACGQSPVCVEVNRLVRSGVVVVIAAGNTGYGSLASSQRDTGVGFMLTINDPGNAEFAITVGSTHRDAPYTYGVSYFSSKGPTGDGRLKPDVVAPGERILSCCSPARAPDNAVHHYVEDSGTSMAAPHVSGIIAAFLSIRREYIGEPEKIKQLFLSTATDLGRHSYFQGRGLVDLMRAIQSV